MSHRPRFNKLDASTTKDQAVRAFNELVDMYNDLADEYEKNFVESAITNTIYKSLESHTLWCVNQVRNAVYDKIHKIGYEIYKNRVLEGDDKPLEN